MSELSEALAIAATMVQEEIQKLIPLRDALIRARGMSKSNARLFAAAPALLAAAQEALGLWPAIRTPEHSAYDDCENSLRASIQQATGEEGK